MHKALASYIKQDIDVTDEELSRILSCFRPLTVKKQEVLLNRGQVNRQINFVTKGCLRLFFIDEKGEEATRYLAFENHFATALVSFISQEPSMEYVQALEDSEVLCIEKPDFERLLETVRNWEKFYRHYLESAYTTNTNRLMSFITMDAQERYRLLLEKNPEVVLRLSNKIVANYLNISQETLSRLKSRV
jgi:CRP-like cAMP-binding protein